MAEPVPAHYNLSLTREGQDGPTVPLKIELPPDDEPRLKALAAKLVEYEQREADSSYRPPNFTPKTEDYKEYALGRLLVDGEVYTRDLWLALYCEPGFREPEFEEAVRVIAAYANGEEGQLVGGTGLAA